MTIRRQLTTIAAAAVLVVFAHAAASADTRENPPSRGQPSATRSVGGSSGGGDPRIAVPRSPSSPSSPSTRHQPQPSDGGGGGYGGGHGRHHYPHHYGCPHGFWGYGYYWPYSRFYRSYWGYPFYPWGMVWYPAYSHDSRAGGLDLSVKPKKAEVWVDGDYVGRAAKFDGFPGHLWLEAGSHELVFYYEGRRTVVREVNVRPGGARRLAVDMQKGESTPVAAIFADREAARLAAVEPAEHGESVGGRQPAVDLRGEPGRFSLEVVPRDAAVYLDGRFLGSGEDLSRLHSRMMVGPGAHLIEVQRPGYESETLEFSVDSGGEKDLQIELETSGGGGS
jgi:hypothetical protein